ncbi:MAG TPA: tyrosine-type recombinase/integrase [Spirochaetota bacterium]|nr:tyrosine-type recombinase/integrase [Spirochaetota bacterium]HPL15178.1 tyrosine-type recombinase/integrase [Spirochaetota bacterium]HQF09888.1 tyrosine-type recombinase/integrase [Spirochaetota bacterium]HQH98539.1 tyrosine-type recombinase/integrase [Spirochaetota bacterium]HQJ71963.1 tyrosine-type recombinase/integrase [Spirochaetota bacterium]
MAYRISSNQKGVPKGKIRFEFDVYIDDKRYRRTQTCQKSAVQAYYKRWERRINNELEGNFTLFEKLDEYLQYSQEMKTPGMYRHEKMIIEEVVKRFFSKDMLLRDVKRAHVDDFIAWRRNHVVSTFDNTKEGGRLSNATINRTMAVLSYFFNWAIKKDYYKSLNPFYMTKLREVNIREVKLSPEDIRGLFQLAQQQDIRLYQIMMIALLTGMRRNEIFSLLWSEVDFASSHIRLSQLKTKSKKARSIPISPILRDILLAIKNNNPSSDKVISNLTPDMLRKGWNRLVAKAPFGKLDDGTRLRFHDLRHLFAQNLLNQGVGLEDIQSILGHESFETTQKRYAMFSRPDLQEKVSRIDNILSPQRKLG